MCLRSQSRIRIRAFPSGVLIGLAVVGALIVWTTEVVYMKQKYVSRFNAGDDFPDHISVHAIKGGNQMNEDQPGTQETKQSALNDETAVNDVAISSTTVNSQINLQTAYGHIKAILFFIGYPRSRHTLLGSLLDAHPHMVIADEKAAFTKWISHPDRWMRNSLYKYYDLMFNATRRAVKVGRRSRLSKQSIVNATSQFRYHVPNQWQGRFDQYIEIIGDKTGATAALTMKRSIKAVDAVHLLEKTAGAKVRIIHVMRNPFDNIATMVLRNKKVQARYGEHKIKVNAPDELEIETKNYFDMAEGCNMAREAFPGSVIDVPSMEIVKNPAKTLRRICQFLEITCTEQYLLDCAATVDPVPSITRDFIEWSAEQKKTVYEMMKKYPFFEGYSYDK